MQAAVGDEEGLAAAVLAVDDAGQIDARLPDQPAAELEDEFRPGERRGNLVQLLAQGLAERLHIELLVAREIGDSETAAEVDLRRSRAGGLRNFGGEREGLAKSLGQRGPVEALRAGIEVEAAPVGIGFDQAAHDLGGAVVIDPERRGEAAHLHARAPQREWRVDPNRQPRPRAQLPGEAQRPRRLAFAFEVDGDATLDRPAQLRVGLAGAGETDVDAADARILKRLQLAKGSGVEAVDIFAKPCQQGRIRVCLDGIMQGNTRRHGGPERGDFRADARLVVNKEWRPPGRFRQRLAIAAADPQAAVRAGFETRRDWTHPLHCQPSSACACSAARSSLPLAPTGNRSRQMMCFGRMNAGSSAANQTRSRSSKSSPSGSAKRRMC